MDAKHAKLAVKKYARKSILACDDYHAIEDEADRVAQKYLDLNGWDMLGLDWHDFTCQVYALAFADYERRNLIAD